MFQFAFYQSLTELPKRLKKILKCTNEKLSKTVFLIMFFQIKILDSNVKIQESIACLFLFSSWPAAPVCTWLERGRTELRPLIQLPDFVVLIGYLKIYVRPPVWIHNNSPSHWYDMTTLWISCTWQWLSTPVVSSEAKKQSQNVLIAISMYMPQVFKVLPLPCSTN